MKPTQGFYTQYQISNQYSLHSIYTQISNQTNKHLNKKI